MSASTWLPVYLVACAGLRRGLACVSSWPTPPSASMPWLVVASLLVRSLCGTHTHTLLVGRVRGAGGRRASPLCFVRGGRWCGIRSRASACFARSHLSEVWVSCWSGAVATTGCRAIVYCVSGEKHTNTDSVYLPFRVRTPRVLATWPIHKRYECRWRICHQYKLCTTVPTCVVLP